LPEILIFTAINLFIISRVPHKETRFVLPVLPYMMMAGGQLTTELIKIRYYVGKAFGIGMILWCLYEQTRHIAFS